jgi:predicted nucleotidyltransferase
MADKTVEVRRMRYNRHIKRKSTEAPALDNIRQRLSSLLEDKTLQFILLFGSHAQGKAHGQSDMDIGFLFDTPVDVVELTNHVSRLLGDDNIDVVDLRQASPLLRYGAAKNGIVLYEREPGLFGQFFSLSYRIYIDTKKLRDARDLRIERFLQSEGPA